MAKRKSSPQKIDDQLAASQPQASYQYPADSRVVRADDLAIGMWVTILELIDADDGYSDGYSYGAYFAEQRRSGREALIGMPLEVVGVNLPFVILAGESNGCGAVSILTFSMVSSRRKPHVFRISDVTLMQITEQYRNSFGG